MDIAWYGYDLFATSMAECQLAIILCCAPFLRALVRRYFPDRTHHSRGTRNEASVADKDTRWSSHGVTFQPVTSPHNSFLPPVNTLAGDVPLELRGEKQGYVELEETPRSHWDDDEPQRGQYDPLQRDHYDQRHQHNATPRITYDLSPSYESLPRTYVPATSPQRTWQNHSYPSPRIR